MPMNIREVMEGVLTNEEQLAIARNFAISQGEFTEEQLGAVLSAAAAARMVNAAWDNVIAGKVNVTLNAAGEPAFTLTASGEAEAKRLIADAGGFDAQSRRAPPS